MASSSGPTKPAKTNPQGLHGEDFPVSPFFAVVLSRRDPTPNPLDMENNLDPRLRESLNIAPAPQHHQQQHHHHHPHPIQYPPIPDGSPQSLYPQTPQSAGNVSEHDGDNDPQDGTPNDPKRPRACEACRGLKVRCEPDANNPNGPCRRCSKANRNCVVTAPSRKRQKKADSRVAELEKKIDALTASLQTQRGGGNGVQMNVAHNNSNNSPNPYQQVTNGGYGTPYIARPDKARMQPTEWTGYPKAPEFDARKPAAPPMVMAGQKRKLVDGRDSVSESTHSRQVVDENIGIPFLGISAPQRKQQTSEYADVVDRGVVTVEMATKMFECYVERMTPIMPAVVFPPNTLAAEVRKNKPTLFLAILAAACGTSYPQLQKSLTKEIMSIFADRIICKGEKTLEIIQALHISTLWYWPPENYEELKFYQLIHIAAVMAIDIGMGRKSKPSKSKPPAGLWRDHPWRRTPFPEPETIEARRAWLACYFLCCNASMGLRRPNLITWSSFMDDCIMALETSPHAAPSDKVLCQWVRSQHIAEEIGAQFSMHDPVASISMADNRIQLSLKGFERDLQKWTAQIPAEIDSPILKMTKHVVNLYMHEVAMHVNHNVDEFKPPFSEDSLHGDMPQTDPLTPAHVDALSICLESVDGIFEIFLKLDVDTIRCLPVAHFVRVAYAVVVLIKMYFAAAKPNADFGKVINKDNMKVEYYLDGLVDVFKAAAAEEKSRPASKFLMVLMMLKTWFHRQRKQQSEQQPEGSDNAPAASADTPGLTPDNTSTYVDNQKKNQRGYATTPLQVLSEAATNNQGGNTSSLPTTPAGWNQQQYPNYDPAMMNQNTPSFVNMAIGNVDPSLGMDLGYTMGDGFEQAMGMTLGVGDFGGNYFNDDMFFNGVLDSVGGGPGFDGF